MLVVICLLGSLDFNNSSISYILLLSGIGILRISIVLGSPDLLNLLVVNIFAFILFFFDAFLALSFVHAVNVVVPFWLQGLVAAAIAAISAIHFHKLVAYGR